jgi:hypothetical protein
MLTMKLRGGVQLPPHSFLTLASERASGEDHALVTFMQGKKAEWAPQSL